VGKHVSCASHARRTFAHALVGIKQVRNQVVKILVFFGRVLALCAYAALTQQAGQQKPPRVARLGVPAEKVEPPQVPLGMQVFPAINSWGLDALAFSLDGEWLASGGYGDTVMVWNSRRTRAVDCV